MRDIEEPGSQKNNSKIIHAARARGDHSLLEIDAESIARSYGISVADSKLARTVEEASDFARKLGFPLAMKIVSKDILHKSDVGGVMTGIGSLKGVRESFAEIIANVKKASPKAEVRGVLVQKMAEKGTEFVVGGTRDPNFGPAVMFGLGGIYVELFKDVSFRLAPLSEKEAFAMMGETRSSLLLNGFRGSKTLDGRSVARTIVAVGKILQDNQEVDSIDINPLLVYPEGVVAVDIRVILREYENSKGQMTK